MQFPPQTLFKGYCAMSRFNSVLVLSQERESSRGPNKCAQRERRPPLAPFLLWERKEFVKIVYGSKLFARHLAFWGGVKSVEESTNFYAGSSSMPCQPRVGFIVKYLVDFSKSTNYDARKLSFHQKHFMPLTHAGFLRCSWSYQESKHVPTH